MADIIPFNRKEREAKRQKEQANKITVQVNMMFTPDGFGVAAEKLTSVQVSLDGVMYFVFGEVGPLCALDIGSYSEALNSALELQKELYRAHKIKIKVY